MKIIKHIIFGVAGILVFGLIMNYLIKTSAAKQLKIKEDKSILVFGDSHAECNFYDVDNEIQNFGVRSESPNFSLLKAQQILKINNNQNIVITLSPHNISTWREKRYYERDSSAGLLSKYWSLVDHKFLIKHYSKLPIKTRALLHLKKMAGAPNIESSFLVKNNFKGGFYRGKDTTVLNMESVKKSFTRHFGDDDFIDNNTELSSSKFKENYKAFMTYANSIDVKVIVIGTPIHSKYLNLLSRQQYDDYKLFLIELRDQFPNISVLDYTELQLPDNYFLDGDHLNFEGAKYFTKLVTKEIHKS